MNSQLMDQHRAAARARNQTFLATYQKWSGDDLLTFTEEYKTQAQMDHAGRYWWFEWDYTMVSYEDLWPDENPLQRTRRLRNKNWETWR